jgi:hypothetical protein
MLGIPPPHALGSVLENTGKLALRTITLNFRSQITWNLPALVLELVEWLNTPQLSTTSKVGLLSYPSFLDLVEPYVGAEISISFQRMLYAESLAYTQPTSDEKHHLSVPELQQIGAVAGHNVLTFLDLKLKSDSLRSASKHDLEAMFLLLVGTILAVGYSNPKMSAENPVSRMSLNISLLSDLKLTLSRNLQAIVPATSQTFKQCKIIYVRSWHTIWSTLDPGLICQSPTMLTGSFSKQHPRGGTKRGYFDG